MKRSWVMVFIAAVLGLSAHSAETGDASFYAGKFQGRLTANGEVFDTKKLTAAHKTLPFNTIVEVENLQNGETVLVRINDRGPFVEGRVIDLSRAAAAAIGMVAQGIAKVSVEVVSLGDGATYHNTAPNRYGTTIIQVASFRDIGNAERTKRLLENEGFPVRFEIVGNEYTRVTIPDVRREDLLVAKAKLRKLGFFNVLLRQQ